MLQSSKALCSQRYSELKPFIWIVRQKYKNKQSQYWLSFWLMGPYHFRRSKKDHVCPELFVSTALWVVYATCWPSCLSHSRPSGGVGRTCVLPFPLTEWPWANYFTTLSLSVFIYNIQFTDLRRFGGRPKLGVMLPSVWNSAGLSVWGHFLGCWPLKGRECLGPEFLVFSTSLDSFIHILCVCV